MAEAKLSVKEVNPSLHPFEGGLRDHRGAAVMPHETGTSLTLHVPRPIIPPAAGRIAHIRKDNTPCRLSPVLS